MPAKHFSLSDFSYPHVRSFEIKKSNLCVYSVSELEFRIYLKASPLIMPVKHEFCYKSTRIYTCYWVESIHATGLRISILFLHVGVRIELT